VGSGELIAATTLGAQVGFVLLWLVIVSTLVKVAVQVELATTGWSTIAADQAALARRRVHGIETVYHHHDSVRSGCRQRA
jgi:Mn2+/Fe2+ NRAMP family transporter